MNWGVFIKNMLSTYYFLGGIVMTKEVLKRWFCWKHFAVAYLYVSIATGVLMLQVSTFLGLFIPIHGFIISTYPIEETSKVGAYIVKIVCAFSFTIMAFASAYALLFLVRNVLTLLKGLY